MGALFDVLLGAVDLLGDPEDVLCLGSLSRMEVEDDLDYCSVAHMGLRGHREMLNGPHRRVGLVDVGHHMELHAVEEDAPREGIVDRIPYVRHMVGTRLDRFFLDGIHLLYTHSALLPVGRKLLHNEDRHLWHHYEKMVVVHLPLVVANVRKEASDLLRTQHIDDLCAYYTEAGICLTVEEAHLRRLCEMSVAVFARSHYDLPLLQVTHTTTMAEAEFS